MAAVADVRASFPKDISTKATVGVIVQEQMHGRLPIAGRRIPEFRCDTAGLATIEYPPE